MATHTIGTGGNFSTAQAWEDDIPGTLTEQRIGQVLNEELVVGGTVIDFSAHVTTSSFNIILEADEGASFKDHANVRTNALRYNASNGAALRNSSSSGNVINFSGASDHVTVRNLQLKHDGTGTYNYAVSVAAHGSTMLFKDLIIEGTQNSGSFAVVYHFGETFVNCLIVQRGTAANGIMNASTNQATIIGCTVVRPSNITAAGVGIYPDYDGDIVKDTIVAGFTTDYQTRGSGTTNTDYNATDLSDGASGFPDPGTDHNVYSMPFTTSTFVQPSDSGGTHDFRAVSSSVVDGTGVYDGTNSPNDISGFARSDPPEIGVWELGAAPRRWILGRP